MIKKRDFENWSKTELVKEIKKSEKRKNLWCSVNKPEKEFMNKYFELWRDERGYTISRLGLILNSNSILFLGYVLIKNTWLGAYVAIIGIVANIFYFLFFWGFAKRMKYLQNKIKSQEVGEFAKISVKGRWGFVPMVIIFELIWIGSVFYTFSGGFI
ncbi:MAG: hypothetical protein KAT28_00765 [Candidatus Aenigmarchaeota archaeon]|nr:hypothetical protein [Candidatus Aenigmarchaeota archaeon]